LVRGARRPVAEQYPPGGPVDLDDRTAAKHRDTGGGIALRVRDKLRAVAGDQRLLGEGRTLIGQMVLIPDQGDRAIKTLFPQRKGCARAAFAGADDDEIRHDENLSAVPAAGTAKTKKARAR